MGLLTTAAICGKLTANQLQLAEVPGSYPGTTEDLTTGTQPNKRDVADTRSGRSACGGLPRRSRKRGARGRGKSRSPLCAKENRYGYMGYR
jgi:hypothetical protein